MKDLTTILLAALLTTIAPLALAEATDGAPAMPRSLTEEIRAQGRAALASMSDDVRSTVDGRREALAGLQAALDPASPKRERLAGGPEPTPCATGGLRALIELLPDTPRVLPPRVPARPRLF